MKLAELVIDCVNDLQTVADKKGLNIKVWDCYTVLYNEHKNKYGSFESFAELNMIDTYNRKMKERYDFILCSLNEHIEGRII